MRCWPGTAALGSWVLLSASDQESAEDVINWNILMQIWIGIKQQCREACLHVCSPSCRMSMMKAAVRPHSSVVSLLALTILMNISENTRVNGVKELVQVDQLIICNYIMEITCRAERMWRVSKAVQHYNTFLCRIVLTFLTNEATFTRQCCHQKQQSVFGVFFKRCACTENDARSHGSALENAVASRAGERPLMGKRGVKATINRIVVINKGICLASLHGPAFKASLLF